MEQSVILLNVLKTNIVLNTLQLKYELINEYTNLKKLIISQIKTF